MPSINGLHNSIENIKDRELDRESAKYKAECKEAAEKQSSVFLESFKKGAKVELIESGRKAGMFTDEQPRIEKVYDKDGNFLYKRTSYQSGRVEYSYSVGGNDIVFTDYDNDGNIDEFNQHSKNGDVFYAKSTKDNGTFDHYGH
jgi:hypothetical protein